ncbi:hypothetical protein PR048_002808 [Dryococelus australis]|uniref:Uncharacterized protein n=1 Tax=Dryococelus australis TaxID=614101 RepID=A0ABQ9ILD5_9NEOP|nr:hypothetical protein PR048_002808 [Dryococelus australis]
MWAPYVTVLWRVAKQSGIFQGFINASGFPCNGGLMHEFVLMEGIVNTYFSADDKLTHIECIVQTNAAMAFYSNMIQPAGHILRTRYQNGVATPQHVAKPFPNTHVTYLDPEEIFACIKLSYEESRYIRNPSIMKLTSGRDRHSFHGPLLPVLTATGITDDLSHRSVYGMSFQQRMMFTTRKDLFSFDGMFCCVQCRPLQPLRMQLPVNRTLWLKGPMDVTLCIYVNQLKERTRDEFGRSRWLRTTNLRVPTSNCLSANTTIKNGVDVVVKHGRWQIKTNNSRSVCIGLTRVHELQQNGGHSTNTVKPYIAVCVKTMGDMKCSCVLRMPWSPLALSRSYSGYFQPGSHTKTGVEKLVWALVPS